MGNQNSDGKGSVDEHQQLMENYNTIKTVQDDKYGEGILMQNKITGGYCILKEYNSTDEQEFDKTYAKYKKRQELNHENIIMLLGLAKKKESQLCSTFYKVYVLYEYTNESLEKRIQLRTQTRKNFQEGELWDFLGQTVSGLNYLHSKGITHQNVKPANIFLDQHSKIKVADSQVIQQLNMFSQVATNLKEPPKNSYLSPALLEALRQSNWSPNHDTGKSDVFSLGMTILSAGLLEDLDSCYSYHPEPIFLEDVFKQRFSQFKNMYSNKLTNFIGIMTSTNEDTRPDFSQLWQQLQQFSYQETHSMVSERSHFDEVIVNQGQDAHNRLKSLHTQEDQHQQPRYAGDASTFVNQKKQSPSTQPKVINDDNENVVDDTEDVLDQIKRQNPQNYTKNYAEKQQHNQLGQAQVESRQPAAPPQRSLTFGVHQQPPAVNPLKNSNVSQQQNQPVTIQSTGIPKQISTPIQSSIPNSFNFIPKPAAAAQSQANAYNSSNPMIKDSQSGQSILVNLPKTSYTCKTQPDENTGAIERGTSRQGEAENFLQSQQSNNIGNQIRSDNITSNYSQLQANNQRPQSRSGSFYNNTNNSQFGNIRSGSSANLHANPSQSNLQYNQGNLGGSVQKQNSFHNSNTSMTKDHNMQNLNDISNIHNYSNIDDFKISNQQSNIFNNNPKMQQGTSTTPYKPPYSAYDNKTKLDDLQNITQVSNTNNANNNSILDNNQRSFINQKDDYSNPTKSVGGIHTASLLNNNNLSSYLPSQYQAKSIGLTSNNTSYNNIPSYSKPADYSFPLTQQFNAPYSQNDGKNLMTNFDELKSKLQEAELRAKQEYESKTGQSISNAPSSHNTSVQQQSSFQQSEYSLPYTKGHMKTNSEVDEIMKKYENKNNSSSYGNQITGNNYGGEQSNRRNSQHKQEGAYTNNYNNYSASPISNNFSNQMQNDSEEQVKKSSLETNNYQKSPLTDNTGSRNITTITSVKTNVVPSFTPSTNVQNYQNQSSQQIYQQYSPQQSFKQEPYQAQQELKQQQQPQQQQQQQQSQYEQFQPTQQQQYNSNDNLPSFNYQQQQLQQYNQDYNNSNQFYSNRFNNDIPEVVIESYTNGSRYEGEKFNGMRHGQGRFFYQDGGLFDGEWRDNKMNGRGVLSYASGKIAYDGNWEEDRFHGFGALYNENPAELLECFDYRDFDQVDEYWIKYDGEFKEDNKDGFGTLYLSNGERFEGSFKNDFVCGPGSFYKINGEKIDGIWQNNKLIQS